MRRVQDHALAGMHMSSPNGPPTRKEPLSAADVKFWKDNVEASTSMIKAIDAAAKRSPIVAEALRLLGGRIVYGMESMWVLRLHSRHEFRFDAMSILRSIYDAHLQAVYILDDPAQVEARARLYREYFVIEQVEYHRRLENHDSEFARRIRESPKREEAMPKILAEFERVKGNYLDSNDKLLRQWYPGDLAVLLTKLGPDLRQELESEYRLMQKMLSGALHSSAFALAGSSAWEGETALIVGWRFLYRVLRRAMQFFGLKLDEFQEIVIAKVDESWFAAFPEASKHEDPTQS